MCDICPLIADTGEPGLVVTIVIPCVDAREKMKTQNIHIIRLPPLHMQDKQFVASLLAEEAKNHTSVLLVV